MKKRIDWAALNDAFWIRADAVIHILVWLGIWAAVFAASAYVVHKFLVP